MLSFPTNKPEQLMALENCVLLVETGSKLHGTSNADSDEDFAGVYVPSPEYAFGLKDYPQVNLGTKPVGSNRPNTPQDRDCTLYSLKRFVSLLLHNNPERMEYLFAPNSSIVHITPVGRRLLESTELFLSRTVYWSFGEYASSQVERLLKESEDKKEYNYKMAAHALRLYIEGRELLTTWKIKFPLTLAPVVKTVKEGGWTKEQFVKEVGEYEDMLDRAYRDTTIHTEVDYEGANELLVELHKLHWGMS